MFPRTIFAPLVAIASLALAPTAHALPDDPQIASVSPADGVTKTAGPKGITVSHTCPDYLSYYFPISGSALTETGGPNDYSVRWSRSSVLDVKGLLTEAPGVLTKRGARDAGGVCSSTLDTANPANFPGVAPGRVYWQANRTCISCASGFEAGPVQSIVLKPRVVRPTLKVGKIYAGYTAAFFVSPPKGVKGGTRTLQRKVGKRWRTIDSTRLPTTYPLFARLPKGRQTIRAVSKSGGTTFVGKARKVVVRTNARRITGARDDGRYKARTKAPTVKMRVAGKGRTIRGLNVTVTALCLGASVSQNRIVPAIAVFPALKVAPDGSVAGRVRVRGTRDTAAIIFGKLRNRRLQATVKMSFSTCVADRKLALVRR